MTTPTNTPPANQVPNANQTPPADQVNLPDEMKKDFFKLKEKAKQQEEEILKLRKEREESENNKLKEQNQYKELYEKAEQKAKEHETKMKELFEQGKNEKRMSAVKDLALKAGIRSEALPDLDLVDMSKIIVEDDGKVVGADLLVDKLKQSRSHWFLDQTPPNVNGSVPRPNTQEKTYTTTELLALQKTNPSAYKEAMAKQYLNRR